MSSKYDPNHNTLQSKFGFQDDDLKTPMHDEIMLWLDNNLESIISNLENCQIYIRRKVWEQPIVTGNNKFTVGFVDMYVEAYGNDGIGIEYCFEIKSTISSLGEVIRQIRLYESHCNSYSKRPKFIVVSPDDRFTSALQSQNIGFIKYQP